MTPKTTWAICVGIESYGTGAAWNLAGPAADARRFAAYLVKRGVPTEQILRFVSPLEERLPQERLPDEKPATREAIYEAFTSVVPALAGDTLFVFWGGHGVTNAADSRYLFYADASEASLKNFDVDDALRFLRSDRIKHLKQQYCFFDACSAFFELRSTKSLETEKFPGGQPSNAVEQWALFAAAPGELAKNDTARRTGLFSRELLAELTAAPDDPWPPDMLALKGGVEQRVLALREAGATGQRVTYYWGRIGDGSKTMVADSAPPRAEPERGSGAEAARPSPVPQPVSLTVAQKQRLARALLACNSMRLPNVRQQLFQDLPSVLYERLDRSTIAVDDVRNAVQTCASYPGGLVELTSLVLDRENGSFAAIHLQTVLSELAVA